MNNTIKIKKSINNVMDRLCKDRKSISSVRPEAMKMPILIAALSSSLLTVSIAHAALPDDMSVFEQAEELPDNALSHMRGKFLASGQVVYFGVEMVTQWQTSAGELITATADLGVNLSGNTPSVAFQPSISAQQGDTSTDTTSYGTSEVGGAGGLDSVSGVVQNIQVAGTSNGVANSIGMNVEMVSAGGSTMVSGIQGQNALSVQTENGSTATVSMGNNAIGVSIAVPSQGQTVQQIRSLAMGGGQVMQSVQLGGDLNQIRNMINLNVQMNALSPSMNTRTGDVLAGLKMLPQTSVF